MDLPLLLSWLSARQYAPEGGFSGRTNKLVDGCYSHWVGGCWPLLQSALDGKPRSTESPLNTVGSLFSREGIDRYILGCCQSPHGGLRDKPGKCVRHLNPWHFHADVADSEAQERGFLSHLLRSRGLERNTTLSLSYGRKCIIQRDVLLGLLVAVLAD